MHDTETEPPNALDGAASRIYQLDLDIHRGCVKAFHKKSAHHVHMSK
jgi:hypothetical protein